MDVLAAAAAFALLAAPAQNQNAPPIGQAGGAGVPEVRLVHWQPGTVTCAGGAVTPLFAPVPLVSSAQFKPDLAEVTFRFAIAADGRTLAIGTMSTRYIPYADDLGPVLAATRFAPGLARSECRIAFRPSILSVDSAPHEVLAAYTVVPGNGRPPLSAFERVFPADTTCLRPTGAKVRLRGYPDFDAIVATPGALPWSMIGFDIDRAGRPRGIHLVASSGSAPLDRASRAAIAASRFAKAARHGCIYPYWRRARPLPAPEIPSVPMFRPAGATCPPETPWARRPVEIYPTEYRRRGIEGWAVIAFDVAPWGQTGNVRVLASQPSEKFGETARSMLQAASKPTGPGATGCVERVRFVMAGSAAAQHQSASDLPD